MRRVAVCAVLLGFAAGVAADGDVACERLFDESKETAEGFFEVIHRMSDGISSSLSPFRGWSIAELILHGQVAMGSATLHPSYKLNRPERLTASRHPDPRP
jgi:hypothetical protein